MADCILKIVIVIPNAEIDKLELEYSFSTFITYEILGTQHIFYCYVENKLN